MFQKALDLYFHVIVLIFLEGSTKVPQILDHIFVDFAVLLLEFLDYPSHRPTQNLKYIENEQNPPYQFFSRLRY